MSSAVLRSSLPHLQDDDACFGTLQVSQGHLPLRSLEVHSELTGLVARTTVRQSFVNTYAQPLEATYIFPLPSRGAVTHFALRVAGRLIEGQLKERGAARQEYQQAIDTGHRAAIAEQERPDVFTMRVGNLPPGELAQVELVLIAPLDVQGAEVTWRFPLVVAPRYIPGNPLPGPSVGDGTSFDTDAVPDASRISPPVLLPNYPNPVRLAMTVDIDTGALPLTQLESSLHAIQTQRSTGGVRVELVPGERLDRDFILRYCVADEVVASSAIGCLDQDTPTRGLFEVTLVPPASVLAARKARDVVFVLDRSGSMDGWKMIAARRAVARMIDSLHAQDRFALLAFDSHVTTPIGLGQTLQQATDRLRYRAVEFLATLDARGGTEMFQPLSMASGLLLDAASPDRERILVFVTDGQVGNEDQLLRALGDALAKLRVFTVGIDRAVNEGFLRRMAQLGGGLCELVESEDRLDEVMSTLHQRIDVPVLTDVRLSFDHARQVPQTLVPSRHANLFAGAPLVLRGQLEQLEPGEQGTHLTIEATDALGQPYRQRIPLKLGASSALGALWARARIRELEDQHAMRRGSLEQIEAQILALSLRYRVLCRFSAFVAVDHHEKITQADPLRQITQPVEQPSGWASAPTPKTSYEGAARSMAAPSGFSSFGQGAPAGAPPMPQAPPFAPAPVPSQAPASPAPMSPGRSYGAVMDSMSLELEDEPAPMLGGASRDEGGFGGKGELPKRKRADRSQTQAGWVRGTIRFLSPEQALGYEATFVSDVFSLACMLYELLTKRALFDAATDMLLLEVLIKCELPSPLLRPEDPALAHALGAVLERALQKDQTLRYDSALAFAQAIEAVLSARGVSASLTGVAASPEQPLQTLRASLSVEQAAVLIARGARSLHIGHLDTQEPHRELDLECVLLNPQGEVHLLWPDDEPDRSMPTPPKRRFFDKVRELLSPSKSESPRRGDFWK